MRLLKIGLHNYRAFAPINDTDVSGAETELLLHWLDISKDIIVIAGENNCGKSCLLSAYRDFHSSSHVMTEADFNGRDISSPIVLELEFCADESELEDDRTAKWFDANHVARVRKVWREPGKKFEKYSFSPVSGEWEANGFGGFDSILQNRLPTPVHIRTDMTVDEMKTVLQKIFKEIVARRIAASENIIKINELLKEVEAELEADPFFVDLNARVSDAASGVFPDISVVFQNPSSNKGVLSLLEKQVDVALSVSDSPELSLDRHGSGSQRVFMLSALSVLNEEISATASKQKKAAEKTSGLVLQIEEPELFLSPTAVKRMRKLLFQMSSEDGFQVMSCTHSPVMIDFSRPRQTFALVKRHESKSFLRQSSADSWGRDHVETLKIMYQLNPAISEAIFAKKIVLVEGETEFAALTKLIEIFDENSAELDVCIIDCAGKGSIKHFQKLLNDLEKDYIAVHDTDVHFDSQNTEWKKNEEIWQNIADARAKGINAIGFAFMPDFEQANGFQATKPKMLNAMRFIENKNSDGTLKATDAYALYDAIKNWSGNFATVEDLRIAAAQEQLV